MSAGHRTLTALLLNIARAQDEIDRLQEAESRRRWRRYRQHGGGPANADPPNTTYASDTFNRANAALNGSLPQVGAAWVETTGQVVIQTNRIHCNVGALTAAYVDSNAGGTYFQAADGWFRGTYPTVGNGGQMLRWVDATNFLYFSGGSGNGKLYRVTNGVHTQIGVNATAIVNGNDMAFYLAGSSITAYKLGVLQFTCTETQGLTSTKHGYASADISAYWDTYSHANA